MENSGLPSIEVNLLFSLNDLFEDCETIDDTKPVFEKLKEVINNSVNLLDDYDFELTSMVSFEDLRKVLNKKYNMFKIECLKFDDCDFITDILGPPPPNNRFGGPDELVLQFELDKHFRGDEEEDFVFSEISTEGILVHMGIRTFDKTKQVGAWYHDGEVDETDIETEPLKLGPNKSNYEWIF